ncbi:MAG: OmpA family protein [Chitinophagales bacterium]|nr:OmpA family protein [Chitinophagales bacterium]
MHRITYFLSVVLLLISTHSEVQAQKLYLKRASTYMEQFDFQNAIDIYNIVIKKHPENTEAISGLAKAYRLTGEPKKAEIYYAKLHESGNATPEDVFYYAQALQSNKKYGIAKEQFKLYNELVPADKRAPEIIMGLNNLDELKSDNPLFQLDSLTINSKASDFAPTYFREGIVFSSNRNSKLIDRTDVWTGFSFLNVYHASINDEGKLSEELLKGKVNNVYHDGPVAFSPDHAIMYLTRSNYLKKKATSSSDNTVKLKIYRLEYSPSKNKWVDIKDPFPFNSSEYSVGHASVSSDGNFLYFMSDMPGGYGETDLYRSEWNGSEWAEAENLGPQINTPGREMFPFIDEAGNLYFSSDGHMGLGGLDLYYSGVSKEGFSRVVHLGTPLNSNRDDFGITMANDSPEGYFSSNRSGGVGKDDIYGFTRNKVIISGIIEDFTTGGPIAGAEISLLRKGESETYAQAFTNDDGSYILIADPDTEQQIEFFKTGYFIEQMDIKTKYEPITINKKLKRRGLIDLNIGVTDKETGEAIPKVKIAFANITDGTKDTVYTDEMGKLNYRLLPDKEYELMLSKDTDSEDEQYIQVSGQISTVDYFFETINKDFELELLKLEVPIVLEDIFYDFDKWNIRKDAEEELGRLLKILEDNPSMEIELSSHADSRGEDEYNLYLTAKRATAAVSWLTQRGIKPYRMIAVGYGEEKLVNNCSNGVPCTAEQHQQNRRTEFTILKF